MSGNKIAKGRMFKPGSCQRVQCVDLFTLRVLSLMICRGESCTKASFLTNIINRYNFDVEHNTAQPQGINSNDIRFKRAVKLMAQISTTLPIMFLRSNINH